MSSSIWPIMESIGLGLSITRLKTALTLQRWNMDTQPEDLVASALNSDENLKLRYEHSESKLLLDAMKKDSSVEQILEQALGL